MSKSRMTMERLLKGEIVERYKEAGNSMLPLIKSNQPVTLKPIDENTYLKKGDIVFCKVRSNFYTHKISKIRGNQYQISNNKGYVNGWIRLDKIFGVVIEIHDK